MKTIENSPGHRTIGREYPKSENRKREQVRNFYLTTALWAPSEESESYETGVRHDGKFRLLQHDGLDWERGHEHVKAQILSGRSFLELEPWERGR